MTASAPAATTVSQPTRAMAAGWPADCPPAADSLNTPAARRRPPSDPPADRRPTPAPRR